MASNTTKSQFLTYQIGRGETGVFQVEPYKSALLPHWRFKTVPIAKESSSILYEKFLGYYEERDFVGMDMARKFIQMGMTRAQRYANYKGGRKFVNGKEKGQKIEKSKGHDDQEEKRKASLVFREAWDRCRAHKGYQELKEDFLQEQGKWKKMKRQESEQFKAEVHEDIKIG